MIEMKKLDLSKIIKKDNINIITTKESLKEVIPFDWSNDVRTQKKSVIISEKNK